MLFIVGAVVGTVAYLSYKKNKKRNDIYPTWTGHLSNQQGESYPVSWRDFKVIDGRIIRCKGNDDQGEFKIKGDIKDDGSVLFSYHKNHNGIITQIQFVGRVVGPNKIAGQWEKSNSRGHFEISCESRTLCVERTLKNNPMLFDKYPLAFTAKEQHVVGVGVDEAGFYRLVGQITKSNKRLRLDVIYPNKFTLYMYVRSQTVGRDYLGTWTTIKGGKGDCRISVTDHFVNSGYQPNHLQGVPLVRPTTPPPIRNQNTQLFTNTLKPPTDGITPRHIQNARLIAASNTLNYPSPRDSQKPRYQGQPDFYQNQTGRNVPKTPFD